MSDCSSENPDLFCENLLANGKPQELREWLYDSNNSLGEYETNAESVKLVEKAYKAGAKNIFAIEIDEYESYGGNSGKLVIELPNEIDGRNSVLKWATVIAEEQGYDAYSDVGQKYVFVALD